jgi:hypothetical protein
VVAVVEDKDVSVVKPAASLKDDLTFIAENSIYQEGRSQEEISGENENIVDKMVEGQKFEHENKELQEKVRNGTLQKAKNDLLYNNIGHLIKLVNSK